MLAEMETKIKTKLKQVGVPDDVLAKLQFTTPPHAALGDVAIGAFPLAAFWKITPPEAAAQLKEFLLEEEIHIAETNVNGPYLNLRFSTEWLVAASQRPRRAASKNQPRVMVEYCQPNTHKEFHIGHLRNACYGAALVNIYRAAGQNIVAATYNNDVGLHVAKTLWAYQKFHATEKPPKEKGRWLAGMYVEATRETEAHPEYKIEVGAVLRALETRDPQWQKLWRTTRGWSLDQFHAIYKELGLKFDISFDEHQVKEAGQKIVDELLARGLAKHSEGAVIMDFTAQKLGVLILRKSDGAGNYATSDLALAEEKFRRQKIAASITITDSRQALYFQQLFTTLHAFGFAQPMQHLGYELVTLPEGSMASRKGNVVLYETLRDEVLEKARATTRARHASWSTRQVEKVARALAMGALRFSMIKQSPLKVIVFDKNEALSFDGYTAPYLQYTVARINSIFKKAPGRGRPNKKYSWNENEHRLWWQIAQYENIIRAAAAKNDPSEITKYLFELCRAFAGYYEEYQVLATEAATRDARLFLLRQLQTVLQQGLTLLGVPLLVAM